jgi:hypothetical protein
LILKKSCTRVWTEPISSGQEPLAGFCERGNEHSGYKNARNCLRADRLLIPEEGLCSMELDNCTLFYKKKYDLMIS